ncbi:hypothetical protein TNCT_150411 [Trichonephila clavata]|uniref:Uncharacterized protein n=1 Tax=Trichonephila clavata TaxID=2740835 RepID=A0A8X6KAB1_TRICU|nr:hypothetical protein TNCT_150411 [Trichonephila clavata]
MADTNVSINFDNYLCGSVDGIPQNRSSLAFSEINDLTTNDNKSRNASDEILSSSKNDEDVTKKKLTGIVKYKSYEQKLIEEAEELLEDSDLVAVDNWRNKGRRSHLDYYNSLNNSKENDESPIKVFKGKRLASPEKLNSVPQKKILIESSNVNKNEIIILSSSSTPSDLQNEVKKIKEKEDHRINSNNQPRQKGFHFRPTPDILYQTITPVNTMKTTIKEKKRKQKKLGILENGNDRNAISVNGVYYLIFNTCAIDSLIHILALAGKDDENFFKYMQENANPMMKFICNYIDKGPVELIYKERLILLYKLFEDKVVDRRQESGLYANELDMWSSISGMWTKCFPRSACFNHVCKICGEFKVPVSMVSVNHQILWEGGFSQLQNSIGTIDSNIRCPKCKLCMINRTLLFNRCICIELNIQNSRRGQLSCKLMNMPAIIQLNNLNYRLRGIVECVKAHFKAFCRRDQDNWALYDDKAKKASRKIVPDAVIYTRID